jgi:hypothetical protein
MARAAVRCFVRFSPTHPSLFAGARDPPLRGLDLAGNSLTGTIPEGISALTLLQWVHVHCCNLPYSYNAVVVNLLTVVRLMDTQHNTVCVATSPPPPPSTLYLALAARFVQNPCGCIAGTHPTVCGVCNPDYPVVGQLIAWLQVLCSCACGVEYPSSSVVFVAPSSGTWAWIPTP